MGYGSIMAKAKAKTLVNIRTLAGNLEVISKVSKALPLPNDSGVIVEDLALALNEAVMVLMATGSLTVDGLATYLSASYDNVPWEKVLPKVLKDDKKAPELSPEKEVITGPGSDKLKDMIEMSKGADPKKTDVGIEPDEIPLSEPPPEVLQEENQGEEVMEEQEVVVEEKKESQPKKKANPVFGIPKKIKERQVVQNASREAMKPKTQQSNTVTWRSILQVKENAKKIKTYGELSRTYPLGTSVHASNRKFVSDILALLTGFMKESKKLRETVAVQEKSLDATAKANAKLRKKVETLTAKLKNAGSGEEEDQKRFELHIRSGMSGLFTVHFGRYDDSPFVARDDDNTAPYLFEMSQLEDGRKVFDANNVFMISREISKFRPVNVNFFVHLLPSQANLDYLDETGEKPRVRRITTYWIDSAEHLHFGPFDIKDPSLMVFGSVNRDFQKEEETE